MFSFQGIIMRKVIVYIDGLNLYYSLLKNTNYKWLDLQRLFEVLFISPDYEIKTIKYFTSKVHDKPPGTSERQQQYLNALDAYCPKVEIIKGKFTKYREVNLPLAENPKQKTTVLKTEEKQTDVNLAIHLVNDAWLNAYDCAVVISQDSDFIPAVQMVTTMKNKKEICIPKFKGTKIIRDLHRFSSIKRTISEDVLQKHQLPDEIPNTKIHKPKGW